MRNFIKTPTGILGACTLLAVGGLGAVTVVTAHDASTRDDRIICLIGQAQKPWHGLEESFNAPPGDTAARERALAKIRAGIEATKPDALERACR